MANGPGHRDDSAGHLNRVLAEVPGIGKPEQGKPALTRTADLRYDRLWRIEGFEFYCETNHFLAADYRGRVVDL